MTPGKERHSDPHESLVDRFSGAFYSFAACLGALGVSGFAAYITSQPLLFPSLGPTAFLIFESPTAGTSSPRNTLIGHAVAILAGALSLAVFGLFRHPSFLIEDVTLARAGAGALSVALTGSLLLLLKSSHPPAGATTLIVSLGLLRKPQQMIVLMAGVVLLTVSGFILNRATGVPVPIWSARGPRKR